MPKAKLTKTTIDTLPVPAKGQTIYFDTDLPGFGLVVGQKSKTFIAQKDIHGHTVRSGIGRYGHFTVDEARKIAKERLYHMSLGINPNDEGKETEIRTITLGVVLESYLKARRNLKPSTQESYRQTLHRYLGDWLGMVMTDIDKKMVGARHARIAAEHSSYVANHTMRILRALFNYTLATFDICPANPVLYLTHVKAWYKETRRRTYIRPSDLAGWWQGVQSLENDTYRDFLLLLLFTGLRRSEAARLRWADINFKDRCFTITDTKNGDPLTLPMGSFLIGLLTERRQRYVNSEFVFQGVGQKGHFVEPKKGIYEVCHTSGIQFTCHDLRRTFITIAESLDVSAYALKRLINHRVTDVTGGYIIVDVERLRRPAEQVELFILERVNDSKS
jgi:integrase